MDRSRSHEPEHDDVAGRWFSKGPMKLCLPLVVSLALVCLGIGLVHADRDLSDRKIELHFTVNLAPPMPEPDSLFISIRADDGTELRRYEVAFNRDMRVFAALPTQGRVRIEVLDSKGRRGDQEVDLGHLSIDPTGSGWMTLKAVTLRWPMAAARPPMREARHDDMAEPPSDLDMQRVFFATDRTEDPTATDPGKRFGPDRANTTTFGDAVVTFPHDHHMGQIERPEWWHFEIHVNPEKHVAIRSVTTSPRDAFWLALDQEIQHWPDRRVLVFVHGYNVNFEGAILRSAQVAFDVRYGGAALLFTWPSLGTFDGYPADEATSEWSTPHFEAMLDTLMTRTSVQSVEIVAHSMGTRIVTRALADLEDRGRFTSGVKINQLVLAAADIDAGTFRELATHLQGAASRITLYGSSNDKAMKASKQFHHFARAGDGGQDIVVLPGIETIDASAVATDFIDHGYVGDNRTVIGDLHGVLIGQTTQQRCCLVQATNVGLQYWLFRP